jgi:hypothetical protein
MSITNTKIWFLLLSVVALFCVGCAAQIQKQEMARARVMANGDEKLAALYYMQMEQNRVNAIMQASQGLRNAGAIYGQGGAHGDSACKRTTVSARTDCSTGFSWQPHLRQAGRV